MNRASEQASGSAAGARCTRRDVLIASGRDLAERHPPASLPVRLNTPVTTDRPRRCHATAHAVWGGVRPRPLPVRKRRGRQRRSTRSRPSTRPCPRSPYGPPRAHPRRPQSQSLSGAPRLGRPPPLLDPLGNSRGTSPTRSRHDGRFGLLAPKSDPKTPYGLDQRVIQSLPKRRPSRRPRVGLFQSSPPESPFRF